ncbi:hypothetical protein DFJ77DRAFT_155277 [Powellomyces hirtus]|nr:hypothetical protein DFJ77DRAFT_155277 [Powellomyces hirtus]
MMLDCKLFTEENVQNKQLGSIAEKDLMEWLGTFSEITEQWLPHLSTPLFPSIIRPSESSLLREFRWACLRYPLCTEKLHAVLSKLFYAFAAADTVENGVDHANSSTGEELIFESLDIFHHLKGEESVSILAANDDLTTPCEIQLDSIFDGRAESARYAHHLSNLWRLDQADLCEVFLDDIRLICEAAQLGIEGFPRDASLLLLCRLVTERRRLSNSPSFLRNVNGHVLLAAYTLAWSLGKAMTSARSHWSRNFVPSK